MQIIFFIFAIPFLCSSFVVYINSLVEVYTNTFLAEESQTENKKSEWFIKDIIYLIKNLTITR